MNKANSYTSLAVLLLLVAVMLQSFNKGLLIADYYSNTAMYAKNCENILKPQLKCKGKCQMIKKITQEEKEQKQNPGRNSENKYESQVSFFSHYEEMIVPQIKEILTNSIVPYSLGHAIDRSFAIFHPPQA